MLCNCWLLNFTLHTESKILPVLIVLYCYMLAGSWLVAWLAGFPSLININMLSCASWPTTHNIVLLSWPWDRILNFTQLQFYICSIYGHCWGMPTTWIKHKKKQEWIIVWPTKYLHIQSTEQCLASSKLNARYPLSTQRVWPPPHSPGGEEVVDQYFGRRQTLDWPLTVYSLYGLATRDFVADPRMRRSSGYI